VGTREHLSVLAIGLVVLGIVLPCVLHAQTDIRSGDKPFTGQMDQLNLWEVKGPIVQSTTKLAIEDGSIIHPKSRTFVKVRPSSSPASFHADRWYEKIVSFDHKMLVSDTDQPKELFFVDLTGGDVMDASSLLSATGEKLLATINEIKERSPNNQRRLEELLRDGIRPYVTREFVNSL